MKRGVWENGIPVFRSYLKNTSNAQLSARVLWRIADLLKMLIRQRALADCAFSYVTHDASGILRLLNALIYKIKM